MGEDTMNDDQLDAELSALAHAALDVTEGEVATAAALAVVRERSLNDDGADVPTAPRRSPWFALAAVAAVIGMVAGGLVIALRDGGDDTIRSAEPAPATDAAPATTVPAVELTVPAATTAPAAPTTTVADAATPLPASVDPQVISVDAADPPPMIEPVPFAAIPLAPNPNGNSIEVAIAPDAVIVQQPGASSVSVVGSADGQVTTLDVPEMLSAVSAGPRRVLYGLGEAVFEEGAAGPPEIRFLAVPFGGERAGQVVAETRVGWNDYLELPAGAFGHGPDGIVDRARNVNVTVLGYVDENGDPIDWQDADQAPPLIEWDRPITAGELPTISVVGTDLAWRLDIRYAPDNGDNYVGPSPPAPTSGGRIIYSEQIGSDLTPGQDFGPSAMPVIAILEPDGSGSWVRLPDEWSVAASDVWGTILIRTSNGEVELARLDDALAALAGPSDAPAGTLAVGYRCDAQNDCTQLASTLDGRIVAYDPVDATLSVLDMTGTTIEAVVEVKDRVDDPGPYLITVGPDDVAYLLDYDVGREFPELRAIPLAGPGAGAIVGRWPAGVDIDLVPTREGLATVGWYAPEPRPNADDPVDRWVDSDGIATTYDGPTLRLGFDGTHDLERVESDGTVRSFALPAHAFPTRGIPQVVPTDGGGALMLTFDGDDPSRGYVTRFDGSWPTSPDGGIDNTDVYFLPDSDPGGFGVALLERAGTIVVREGDRFVRRTLDEIGTPGWAGGLETETVNDVWIVTAPGLNEYIDVNQPAWAADPLDLARQLLSSVGLGERIETRFDAAGNVLTIETSDLRDDSVFAVRYQFLLSSGADGLYRIDSGRSAQQCQPGRGQQEFVPARCT